MEEESFFSVIFESLLYMILFGYTLWQINASCEYRYCKEMSDLKVHRWPALTDDHAFIVASSFGRYVQGLHKSTLDEISTLRINQELDSLAMGLPVAWASSIFVVADEARVNVMR